MTYVPGGGGGSGSVSTSSDVALNNASDGQVLSYDASLAKWVNAPMTPIIQMTQADYDALATKDPATLYVIVG